MEHIHHQLNFLAILVSAAVLWFLGAFWFSPVLFAKPWAAIVGREMGQKPKGVVHGMISSFIGDILVSLVLEHFVVWGHADGFLHGALFGFITWLGYIAGVQYPQHIYEGRPFKYFAITAGYWLVALPVAGGILAVWR